MKQLLSKLNRVLLPILLLTMLFPMSAAAAEYSCSANIPVRVQVVAEVDTEFTVQLTAEDNAPMPEQDTITFHGSGEGTFGPIVYNAPGDYRYTIRQMPGNAEYVTYDDTVYTITVRVTNAADGGLGTEIWGVRDGESEKIDEVVFYNRYTEPDTPQPDQPTPDGDGQGDSPKTGDSAPVELLVGITVLAAVGLILLVVIPRRYSRKDKK